MADTVKSHEQRPPRVVFEPHEVLQLHAATTGLASAGECHADTLVELTGGTVGLGRPDVDTPAAHRTRNVDDVKEHGSTNSSVLLSWTDEHH